MRIGLGTGSVVVGFAGHDVLRFTMFGEALSRAHLMADSGLPMAIHLHDAAHLALATFNYFTCVQRTHSKVGFSWVFCCCPCFCV